MGYIAKIKSSREEIVKLLVEQFTNRKLHQIEALIWYQDIFEIILEEVGIKLNGSWDYEEILALSAEILSEALEQLGYTKARIKCVLSGEL